MIWEIFAIINENSEKHIFKAEKTNVAEGGDSPGKNGDGGLHHQNSLETCLNQNKTTSPTVSVTKSAVPQPQETKISLVKDASKRKSRVSQFMNYFNNRKEKVKTLSQHSQMTIGQSDDGDEQMMFKKDDFYGDFELAMTSPRIDEMPEGREKK